MPIRPQNFTRMIQEELVRRQWTTYRLHKELEGKMSRQTLYDILAGEADPKGETLAMIFQVLDFEVVARGKK